MGYSHYHYTTAELNQDGFKKTVSDFKRMITPLSHLGIKLGNAWGEDVPEINDNLICFNGLAKCGHEKHQLGLVWPSENARGVKPDHTFMQMKDLSKGNWFAGREVELRVCGGDCSYETFTLGQKADHATRGYAFDCCKTNYKPYDLAVQVALVIAKHNLKDQIIVKSDGDESKWVEAKQLCQHFLGYGEDFKLGGDEKTLIQKQEEPTPIKIDMNTVKVGDIFVRSWGYDQTNVDYAKVIYVSKTGKSAKLQRIGSKSVEALGDMSDHVIPDPEHELENYKVILGRIKKYNDLVYLYCGDYHKWDGKPDYRSSYA